MDTSGKLIIRLAEAALGGDHEHIKILINLLSTEFRKESPELSMYLAKLSSSPMRGMRGVVNPHSISSQSTSENFLISDSKNRSIETPILSLNNKATLLQIVKEHKHATTLLSNNLEPSKTLIFTGPPGVGKTISARWLASELNLNLKILDLAMVMSSHLGKTGNNLKNVIDEAASTPCVLLLDEFDAIAKKRGDESDIGELKRLVTVLLQAMDSWPHTSILIAATNHPELLDPAVWRRFEQRIEFQLPDRDQIQEYLFQLTNLQNSDNIAPLFKDLSFSDIKTEVQKCKKNSLINNSDLISEIIKSCVAKIDQKNLSIAEKKAVSLSLVGAKLSVRSVATILKIARKTITVNLEKQGKGNDKQRTNKGDISKRRKILPTQ